MGGCIMQFQVMNLTVKYQISLGIVFRKLIFGFNN